jgi:hypothetical protein
MRRRTFLGLLSALAAGAPWLLEARPTLAQIDRLTWWAESTSQQVFLEWRYLAGRITLDGQDFGFVVSIAKYEIPDSDPSPQLLVMRQGFGGAAEHASNNYLSTKNYANGTHTYNATSGAASAVWSFDSTAQTYQLNLSSPELSFADLILEPVGSLIPEGGDGEIITAAFGGVEIVSDYYADWVRILRDGTLLGYGRLDMQTIKPRLSQEPGPRNFSHHWFAVAALVGGEEVWITAWRLVSNTVSWVITIARGSGETWSVESITEGTAGVAFPLDVTILAYQPQPVEAGQPARRTGQRWRLRAGRAAQGDILDLEIGVAPGQFIKEGRVANELVQLTDMQEAVTADASGSLGGAPLSEARFAVAESTFSEPVPPGEPPPEEPPPAKELLFLPLLGS